MAWYLPKLVIEFEFDPTSQNLIHVKTNIDIRYDFETTQNNWFEINSLTRMNTFKLQIKGFQNILDLTI